jgi:hypothetical protein
MFFYKKLKNLNPDLESEFLSEVLSTKSVWFTAKNLEDGSLEFVLNKPNGQFYMSRLTRFTNLVDNISEMYPEANLKNSYITKCMPGYHMIPHIDANRKTALIIPLGNNKGKLSYYVFGKKIITHTYTGPLLSRVDRYHSAENDSPDIRYSITLEIPGSFLSNYFKYQ